MTKIKVDKKDLLTHYNKWKKDNSRVIEFEKSKQEIISRPDDNRLLPKALVEAYLYYPKATSKDIASSYEGFSTEALSLIKNTGLLTVSQQYRLTTLPFVKIIWSNDPFIKSGDIYCVKDKLATIEYNSKYRDWWSQRAQQPSLEGKVPMPSQFKAGWDAWAMYKYKINKLSKTPKLLDDFTFLIPTDPYNFLIAKSNI